MEALRRGRSTRRFARRWGGLTRFAARRAGPGRRVRDTPWRRVRDTPWRRAGGTRLRRAGSRHLDRAAGTRLLPIGSTRFGCICRGGFGRVRHWPIIWRCGAREATGGRSAESSMAQARDLSDFSRQRLFAAWPQTELWRCVNVACALARSLASPRGMIAMHGQPATGNRAQTMSKMGQLAACAASPLLGATLATSATPARAACKRHVNERYASGIFQTPTELQARLRWRNTTRECDGYACALPYGRPGQQMALSR
jgi:hypothetical protein